MIRRIGVTAKYVVLAATAIICLFPLLVAIDTAVKSDDDIAGVQSWVPKSFSLNAVTKALSGHLLWHWLRNSLIIALGVGTLTLLLGVPAAYALARRRFRGARPFLDVILITQTVAPAVLIVPLFRIVSQLGLLDSYTSVILVSTAFVLPFGIWLLVAFFRQLPDEIEEAAALDGCVGLRFVLRFILPICAPGITATGVWAFIYGWNEYMFSLTFLSGASDKWPITIGVSSSQGLYSVSWQALMVTSIFGAVPVLIVFVIFRRQLESGLSSATVQ